MQQHFACHWRQLPASLILEVYPQRNSLGRGKTERSAEGGSVDGGGINCALQCPNASAAALARFPSALYTRKKQQNACTHTSSNTHSYIHSLKLSETATATLFNYPPLSSRSLYSVLFYSLSHHPLCKCSLVIRFPIGRNLSFSWRHAIKMDSNLLLMPFCVKIHYSRNFIESHCQTIFDFIQEMQFQ